MKDLSRLFRLSKKTGDRLIVHDTGTDESFVIMDIDEYEFLAVRDTKAEGDTPFTFGDGDSSLFDINEEESEDENDDNDWYHTRDVIEDRYGREYEKAFDKEYDEEEKKIVGGEEKFFADLHEIPFEPVRQDFANQWKEEPLRDDDEPVFFEEPV